MKIDYPIAIDSDYGIWSAFNNRYWPAMYFVDSKGRIRHHQFGEGEYEQSERIIQQLLTRREMATSDMRWFAVNEKVLKLPPTGQSEIG
jgi:hypothetical protein